MRLLCFLIGVSICFATYGQEGNEVTVPETTKNQSDRDSYIKSYPDYFFIWPVLKQRRLDFELSNLSGDKHKLSYKSNKPYSFGVGFYLFEFGVELAFAIPLDEQSKRIYGETETTDVQLNLLGKRWGIDAFYQNYDGFYISDDRTTIPAQTAYPQRGDIETRSIGIGTNYTFNHKRFSFRSAYNFTERQVRSSGSAVVFSALSNVNVAGDSALIGDRFQESFAEGWQTRRISSTRFGIAPGYTYSLIFNGYFLNGTLGIGPSINWVRGDDESGRHTTETNVRTMLTARLAIGYNGDRIFGGLTFINQGANSRIQNMELTHSNSTFKILVGYRFRETGILKKRVADIPRALFN